MRIKAAVKTKKTTAPKKQMEKQMSVHERKMEMARIDLVPTKKIILYDGTVTTLGEMGKYYK